LAGYSGFFVHSDAFEDLSSFVPVFAQCLFVISKVMNWLVIRTIINASLLVELKENQTSLLATVV
jgi:hypothetical protein